MIKVEAQKIYELQLEMDRGGNEEVNSIIELIAEHHNGKNIDVYKIFNFLRDNTRHLVPFKKVLDELPGFRVVTATNKHVYIIVRWELSKTETDFIF